MTMIRQMFALAERYVTAIERTADATVAISRGQRDHADTFRRHVDMMIEDRERVARANAEASIEIENLRLAVDEARVIIEKAVPAA